MIKPTIHLNGTAGMDLYAEYCSAHSALAEAIAALGRVTVHGRDYYPQGDDAFRTAAREHAARLSALLVVRDELEALALHCTDEVHKRRAQ